MKQKVIVFLICSLFLSSLLFLIIPSPQNNTSENSNGNLQTKLTHDNIHIFLQDFFSNGQYFNTEGNNTISLSQWDFEESYNFTDDTAGEPPSVYTSTACYVETSYDGRDKVVKLYANTSYAQASFEIRNTTEKLKVGSYSLWFWMNSTVMDDCYIQIYTGSYSPSHAGCEIYIGKFGSTYGITVFNYSASKYITSIEYDCWNFLNITISCPSFSLYLNNNTCLGTFQFDHLNPATFLDRILFTSYGQHYIDDVNFGGTDGFFETGSYESPLINETIGTNGVIHGILFDLDTFGDSDVLLYGDFSVDGGLHWLYDIPFLSNYTTDTPFINGFLFRFYLNFTSDGDTTGLFYFLEVNWTETILNEIPYAIDLLPEDDSIDLPLETSLSFTILDPDNDTMDLDVYLNDEIIYNSTNCLNGTHYVIALENLTYSTNYHWYIHLNDGENETDSSLFEFTTEDEPTEPPEPEPELNIQLVFIEIFAFVLGFGLLIFKAGTKKSK